MLVDQMMGGRGMRAGSATIRPQGEPPRARMRSNLGEVPTTLKPARFAEIGPLGEAATNDENMAEYRGIGRCLF